LANLKQHILRQSVFSRATFGPTPRTAGVTDHIKKELEEVRTAKTHDERVKEWTDVVILALDGLWREIMYGQPHGLWDFPKVAEIAEANILAKQAKNEKRNWPDWRTADPNKAIEHDRSGEAVAKEADRWA